jgi:predicted HicB family RNase H-like nuclease
MDAQTEVDVLTKSAQKLAAEKRQHAERVRAKHQAIQQQSKLELDQRTRLVDEKLRRTKIATIERAAAIRTRALKTGSSASSENNAERQAKEVEDRWRQEYHQAEVDYEQEARTIHRTFEQGTKEAAEIEAEARLIQKTTDRQVRDLLEDAKRRADEIRKEARKTRTRITKEVDRLYRELEVVQVNSAQEVPGTRPPTSRLKKMVGGMSKRMSAIF